MTTRFEAGDRVTVEGYDGIAFIITGFGETWIPFSYLVLDRDGNETGYVEEDGDGDWESDYDRFVCVMVGDDRKHTFGADDLTLLSDPVCSCGQIGCMAESFA